MNVFSNNHSFIAIKTLPCGVTTLKEKELDELWYVCLKWNFSYVIQTICYLPLECVFHPPLSLGVSCNLRLQPNHEALIGMVLGSNLVPPLLSLLNTSRKLQEVVVVSAWCKVLGKQNCLLNHRNNLNAQQ